jgi:hypothetical protein
VIIQERFAMLINLPVLMLVILLVGLLGLILQVAPLLLRVVAIMLFKESAELYLFKRKENKNEYKF